MTQSENVGNAAPDADKARRPGYPMEHAPRNAGNAYWSSVELQPAQTGILKEPSRAAPPATFGTELKPKGLSGVLRRAAYTFPDYLVRRWMLLLLADRVEGIEYSSSRAVRKPGFWLLAASLLGGSLILRRGRLLRPKHVRFPQLF